MKKKNEKTKFYEKKKERKLNLKNSNKILLYSIRRNLFLYYISDVYIFMRRKWKGHLQAVFFKLYLNTYAYKQRKSFFFKNSYWKS